MLQKVTILALLEDDLENKKPFSAKWEMDCNECGEHIDKGDEFFFFVKELKENETQKK